jgi:hypothetical protein
MEQVTVAPEANTFEQETPAPMAEALRELSAFELALIGGGTISGTYL